MWLFSDRTVAKIHGCIGPAFFLAVVGFCVVTSRWWFSQESYRAAGKPKWSMTTIWPTCDAGRILLPIGCRCISSPHPGSRNAPAQYQGLIVLHVLVAISLVLGTLIQALLVARANRHEPASRGLVWSMRFLILAILVQVSLGVGTWVVKFGWPIWFADMEFAAGYVVPEKSMFQMNLITAHVAVGSLILALWTVQVF